MRAAIHARDCLSTAVRREPVVVQPPPTSAVLHMAWFGLALLVFPSIAWILTARLGVGDELFYAVFIWAGITFLWAYASETGTRVLPPLAQRVGSSLLLGVAAAWAVTWVVGSDPATERPEGVAFILAVALRGFAYGLVNALVFAAFPAWVAAGVLRSRPGRSRLVHGALTLVLVWALSGVFHLGFAHFDDGHLLDAEIGATIVATPVVVTANPLGSALAMTALHVGTAVHAYESPVYAPPHVDFHPRWQPPGVFGSCATQPTC